MKEYKLLSKIKSPADLRCMQEKELSALAGEIRDCITATVLKNGGHLASNLGTVELTLALHRVLNTPDDRIIFDVGHQCYTHKLITGRFDRFDTLRQPGGLSGFTKRAESEYDCFGCGHSSTSLSAAIGFAEADRIAGKENFTVAVIGDGAYTGGMIHEALNNCRRDLRLIIILNENEMSISKNTGAFADHIARLRASDGYYSTKRKTVHALNKVPLIGNFLFRAIRKVKKSVKDLMYGSNYFEDLGLYYLGPVDGNDREKVEVLLKEAVAYGKSTVIHIKTKKGKGFGPAEAAPDVFHSIKAGIYDADGNPITEETEKKETFSDAAGQVLCELASEHDNVCAVTAAMCEGTGLTEFRRKFPERFFDVGIAEEHALTFSAGLAANGMRPFFAVYSSFLQRGYDNLIHDIALQKLPVVLCVDRAGLNPSDGDTHGGIYDVSFLSQIKGFTLYTPAVYPVLKEVFSEAYRSELPSAIRYESGCENGEVLNRFYPDGCEAIHGAVSDYLEPENKKKIIITYGRAAKIALEAEKELGKNAGTILLEIVKPAKKAAEAVQKLLPVSEAEIIFYEEGIYSGGAGMMLGDVLQKQGVLKNKTYRIIAIDPPTSDDPGYTGKAEDILK